MSESQISCALDCNVIWEKNHHLEEPAYERNEAWPPKSSSSASHAPVLASDACNSEGSAAIGPLLWQAFVHRALTRMLVTVCRGAQQTFPVSVDVIFHFVAGLVGQGPAQLNNKKFLTLSLFQALLVDLVEASAEARNCLGTLSRRSPKVQVDSSVLW